MRLPTLCALLLPLLVNRAATSQAIPHTVDAAEAEGASYATYAAPAVTASVFDLPFVGTLERRCVAPPADGSALGGSLRSGEIIVRGHLLAPTQSRGGSGHKLLWMPLHNPSDYPDTLLLRGIDLQSAKDTLRVTRPDGAYAAGRKRSESGFPSGIVLPAAGTWMIVATTRRDWGCFLFTVGG
jgi:hypothetical protein